VGVNLLESDENHRIANLGTLSNRKQSVTFCETSRFLNAPVLAVDNPGRSVRRSRTYGWRRATLSSSRASSASSVLIALLSGWG
jgi:hypothetical protein